MPGSLVVMPPCAVERPGAKRGGATVRSATRVKPEQASSRSRRWAGRGGAEPVYGRRRPWKAPGIRERAPRNPPAYWAWNGRMVVLGTGESLLGPVAVGGGKRCSPITGDPGKWRAGERQSERAVVVPDRRDNTTRRERRARASSMHGKDERDAVSADLKARSVSRATGVDRVRALQRVLYRCAKQDRDRRFHALFDKVARSDVMLRAWGEVTSPSRAARGRPGRSGYRRWRTGW